MILFGGAFPAIEAGVEFVIYFDLLERVGALEVTLVTYLNPIVALLVGWLFLGEPVVPTAIVGLLVVFVGFVVIKNKELAAELARYRGAARWSVEPSAGFRDRRLARHRRRLSRWSTLLASRR